jgi:hypothetical protein
MNYIQYRINNNVINNKKIVERVPSYDINTKRPKSGVNINNNSNNNTNINTNNNSNYNDNDFINKNIQGLYKEKRDIISNPKTQQCNVNKIKDEYSGYGRIPNNKVNISENNISKISNVNVSTPNQNNKKILNINKTPNNISNNIINNFINNNNKYNYVSKEKDKNSNQILRQENKSVSPYMITSDDTRENKNIKISSRPESANVPSSLRVQKRINDNIINSSQNKRISPIRNINMIMNSNLNTNIKSIPTNNYNSKLNQNQRNLTPNKLNENYNSPFMPIKEYQTKKPNNIAVSLSSNNNQVRQRPLSGVNPHISKINNINIPIKGLNNAYNVKNSIISKINNKVGLKDNYNLYNKRNYTPTPSNIKSNRYELDAYKKNYMINLSNNPNDLISKRNVNENINRISNINNNNNINIPRTPNQNTNINKNNKTPITKNENRSDNDINNYYNQGKNIQNIYYMKNINSNNQDLINKIEIYKNNYSDKKYANRYSNNDTLSNNYRK